MKHDLRTFLFVVTVVACSVVASLFSSQLVSAQDGDNPVAITSTATEMPSPTPTFTSTATPTPTPTLFESPLVTPTPTATPTDMVTVTPTATPTTVIIEPVPIPEPISFVLFATGVGAVSALAALKRRRQD